MGKPEKAVGKQYLVRVEHENIIPSDHLSEDGQPAKIAVNVSADLELIVVETVELGLPQQLAHLVVRIAQPSCRGRVDRRSPVGLDLAQTRRLAILTLSQELDGLLRRDGVGDVSKVDTVDEFLGCKIRHEAPHRLALCLGPQVPERVDHGSKGQMRDALLGPYPAQLGIGDQISPGATHVGRQGGKGSIDE